VFEQAGRTPIEFGQGVGVGPATFVEDNCWFIGMACCRALDQLLDP